MKKLKKISLLNELKVLNELEMKKISGGSGYYRWECYCADNGYSWYMYGDFGDVYDVCEVYCGVNQPCRCNKI